ncbi:conjugal transfer relaxosome component TraJ [Legionella birminghamensis]|uniref:Conjugal transfer relaxosome component TraJ n=1 Tax=Legionella birminghamensis TaxID=28083 RepID=A0A378JQP5_9GAMM|nr:MULTISPECIES: conjugal transfer transcriptional regulator TraJ [Legionella]KTC71791.1 conjugal transfer relaxosome component TraJ [Legionella birminghamensis]MCW8452570.1 conjugal transfer transcriptional regulator TraJ [Legionella quinlivanii]STX60853.1 traJ protein [Legionella birminghamensis]
MRSEKNCATRKHGKHLRVPVLPSEESEIKSNAGKAGLSVADYLRRLGMGYRIESVLDQEHILTLAKINADLGRLGGLLKLWLTNDERLSRFSPAMIHALLHRLENTQEALLSVVKKI